MVTQYHGLLDADSIQHLLHYHITEDHRVDQRPDVRSKHPRWNQDPWPQLIVQQVLDHVLDYAYHVEETVFNESRIAFRLHADSGDGSDACVNADAVLIPLLVQGPSHTVFFQNHWRRPSTKFSRVVIADFEYTLPGRDGTWILVPDLKTLLHQCVQDPDSVVDFAVDADFVDQVRRLIAARSGSAISQRDGRCYDYDLVEGYDVGKQFDQEFWRQYLSHIPVQNLTGLTVDRVVAWQPGDVIVFPRTQLHCAAAGHERKIGITVFTQRA